MLNFFGRGNAFSDNHNSAFFTNKNDLILLDCPMAAFHAVKYFELNRFKSIYVLVTHTHGDHVGGIGTLLQYLYFVHSKILTIIAPSTDVKSDLILLLTRIEGCKKEWYKVITADELNESWFIKAVPTHHTETLINRTFGYVLKIDGKISVYTGDTCTLEPFKPYIKRGTVLYTELSFNKSDVHLSCEKYLQILKEYSNNNVDIFLMHLDNEEAILKEIKDTKIKLAPLYRK